MSFDICELSQKYSSQIDEVDSLVDEFPAPGNFGIGSPFSIVADPPP